MKFYTDEGNWDIVGNNIPVFFIQDDIKFPDIIHAGASLGNLLSISVVCSPIHRKTRASQ